MPDFDKNLNPILPNTKKSIPILDNPATPTPDNYASLGGGSLRDANSDPIFGNGPVISKMLPTVTAGELFENRRYATYDANIIDIEDQKAYAQSTWDKAANGVLKGLNLAATTVAGGFGMLYGAAKSPFTGRLADIWDNEVMRGLDKYNNEVDQNWLPNYYTNIEKDAKWYSPDNWFTANFLFDKLIKNSGFAVGAMVSGNIANAGLLRAGAAIGRGASSLAAASEASQAFKLFTPILKNTARAFSAGKNIEAAAVLEKEISSIADVAAKSSKLADIAKSTNAFSEFGLGARRTAIAAYSSAGEASFEALQTANEYRTNLIEQYKKSNNGEEPTGADLQKINEYAEAVGKTSFFGNLGILTITEYSQLPKLLGSSYSAERRAANSLIGKTDDVVLKKGKYIAASDATTKFSKLMDKATGVSKYIFDPKEAAQEGLQYALQVGTQNYFNKAYQSKAADAWVDGFVYGFTGENEKGEAVGLLGSKEGMESMVLGGLTGAMMQIKGNIAERKQLRTNTDRFINELNGAPTFKESFKERLASANRGIVLQEQQQNAVLQGDKLEAKDLEADMMHNYLSSRIKYGRFDMVMDDIAELKQMGSTEQGLASLKQQGIANVNDTVQSYQQRLNNFENVAKNTDEIYRSYDLRYSGEVLKDAEGNPVLTSEGRQQRKYSPAVIDKMVYAASKVADYDLRIPLVSETVITKAKDKKGNNIVIDLQGIVDSELSDDSSTALAYQINELDKNGDPITTPEVKQSLKDVVEMSLRRRKFLNEYREMTDTPEKFYETGERKQFNEEGKRFRTTPSETPEGGKNWAAMSRLPFKGDKRTYDDLVKQYGEGEQSKYNVLKKITESPYATTMEKELASQFMKYTDRSAKIILGDRALPNPGVSVTDFSSPTASVSRINFEYNADDYEGVTIPAEYVILHEIGHDLTVYALSDKSDPFYNDLEPLFNFVQEHFKNDENKYANNGLIKNGEFYAFKNIKEFATEALSNRDFQRYLNTIPYRNTTRSVWDNFVDNLKSFFRRLFGISNDTALDEVVGIVTNNIDRVYKSKREQNEKLTEEEKRLARDKQILSKAQEEIEATNGGVSTGNPETESKGEEPEGKLRAAKTHFISGTSESEKYADPSKTAPHIIRSRQFLNNAKNFKNRANLRAILVTPAQMEALGLKGLAQMSYGKPLDTPLSDIPDINNVQRGLIAQVFVVQEGGKVFFVNKNGQKLTEVGGKDSSGNIIPADLNEVIFQTMPVTQDEKGEMKLLDSKGRKIYRENQKDEFVAYNQAWAKSREQLFKMPLGKYPIFEFTISRGVPKKIDVNGKPEQNHVGGILVEESKIAGTQGLIVIPTTGTIAHNGELIKFSNGRPVLQDGDTLEFLNNRQFSDKQANTLFQVIKSLSEGYISKRTLERKYTKFLKSVMFYSKKEGVNNRFYINPDTSEVMIGSKKFFITEIAEKENEIKEELKKIYHNVNNDNLTTGFNDKFIEFYIDKEGKLSEREWKNYQSYLLSSSYPDGSSRLVGETPLFTNVTAPNKTTGSQSFEQKYATLEGLTLDVQFTPKPAPVTPAAPAATDTTKFDYTGKENKFKVGEFGNVTFIVSKPGEDPEFDTESDEFKSTRDKIVEKLKEKDPDLDTETAEKQASSIISNVVKGEIKKDLTPAQPTAQPTPQAPAAQPQAQQPTPAPVSDIEAKKADIETKRKEQLNKIPNVRLPINAISAVRNKKKDVVTGKDWEDANQEEVNKLQKEYDEYVQKGVYTTKGMVFKHLNEAKEALSKVKEINAKYDAELAASEGKPTPKDDGPTDGPSDNSMDMDFRMVAEGEVGGMTDEEFELFKAWHAKNVPLIPFEVLENMIKVNDTEKAWGVFEEGVAKFVRGGLRGTEYHEVFEGIWKMLPKEQRDAIISELRESGKDFTDRESRKTLNYSTATERQIKERIADDFSDYRLGKLPARTLGEKIRRFFKAIMDFFKSFVSKPSLKKELFKAIDTGKFKDKSLPDSVKSDPAEYRMRGIENMSQKEVHDWVQDMQARASRILYKESKEKLFQPGGVTSNELFDAIKEQYKNEKYKGVIKADYLESNWNELIKRTKQSLRTLGINFNEEDRVDINDVNYNNRLYTPEPFTVDYKKTSTGPLKFTVATLIQMKALNQEGKLTIEAPKPEISSVGGYKLASYNRSFATLMDKLSNTSSVKKFISKLLSLGKNDSIYLQLFQKLGGKISTETMDFDNFSNADWRLFIQAIQTFAKQKPEAYAQYIKDNETYTAPANLYTAINETKRQWMDNMKVIAGKPLKAIPSNLQGDDRLRWVIDNDYKLIRFQDNVYKVDTATLKLFPVRDGLQMIKMLKSIGIEFPVDVYTSLKTTDKTNFAKAVSSIVSYFGSNEDVMKITKETIGINGPLSTLAELVVKTTNPNSESTYFNLEGERVNSYTENNLPSVFENEFNEVNTIDELLALRPELRENFYLDESGELQTHSQVLKKGGRFFDEDGNRTDAMVKVSYIQGTDDDGKARPTSKLGLGMRSTQQINQNLNGDYYVLIPADGSTEWMINLGNTISFQDFDADRAWSSVNKIFKGYLMDDIALARDAKNREKNRNVAPRAYELRFFNDILSEDVLTGLNELIRSEETTDEQIEEYVNNNIDDINDSIKSYIEGTVKKTKANLLRDRQLLAYDVVNGERVYSYPDLQNNFASKNDLDKNKLSDKDVTNLITFLNTNFIINNIEMHKILIGDPFQFKIDVKGGKTILDETKRVKSLLSPARTTFDHPIFNNHLNDTLNKVGEVSLKEGDPGYHEHKAYTNTVTFADDKIVGSLANVMSAYGDVNVADAASWIMDTTHREMQNKNGQWTDEAEAFHQWQMAYTRKQLAKKGDWSYENNPGLEKVDNQLLSKPVPKHTLAVIKPIVRGYKYGSTNMDLVIDKFSQMPLYYSMVEGTNLEKMYLQMMKQGVGYGIVVSGRKVGAEQLQPLYKDGKFNEDAFNNNIKVPWKAYSVQVETAFEAPKEQPIGSQLTKLSSLDLYENGEASPEAKRLYEKNTRILRDMILNGYRGLLDKFGIIDTGFGFVMPNGERVSEALMKEMLRREMSDNAIDTIQTDENKQFLVPFEASPSYIQIRDIMYAMIDKAIVTRKMTGGSYVQVPVTGWENSEKGRGLVRKVDGKWTKITKSQYEDLNDSEKKSVVLTDDTLKFYEDADGKRYCEVMLPAWFKDKVIGRKLQNGEKLTEEEQAILSGIGFRIPTQAMSSVEVFRVKGFLPEYMGYTVVVPAEITTKAGSDFDIDKLNMYLKATYIDENGKLRLVKYMDSEEATKDFYSKVFDKKLEKKRANKAELAEAADIIINNLDDPKNLTSRYSDLIDEMMEDFEGENNVTDFENYLKDQLDRINDDSLQATLKDKFVKRMYKKSLENEYYDTLEKMISLPENFRRLISPVSDGGLPKVAERLDELRGYNESAIKNRILDREYLTSLRHAFLLGKKWIGIAAVNITGHSLFQKSKMYIDPAKLSELSEQDQKFLGDLSIALDHNTIDINGETRISMSGRMTADEKEEDREYISDRLSGYATSFVDVAKDPYILKIIKSDLIVGTFMFLERIGAGKQAAAFLNQPIISEYLSYLDSEGQRSLFTKQNINFIKSKFITTSDLIDAAKLDVSISNLEGNIEAYSKNRKLSPEKNAEQIAIFNEFLKYAKMAEQNFEFTQAINYDTTKFRGGDAFARKQWRTEKAKQANIISSIDNIFETSFIGDLEEALRFAMGSMEAVFKLEKADMRMLVEDVIRPYGENKYIGNDEFEKIAIRAKSALLDYIIETKTNLGDRLKELLVDKETAVANRLLDLKGRYPDLQILKDLVIDTSERPDGAKTVKLLANTKDAYDENLYTGYMRELRDFNEETRAFYYDLVAVSISQGTYQSPVTFRNIVPIEDYSNILAPALSVLTADESMKEFVSSFAKNNFKDDDVMPRFTPKFFLSSETPVSVEIDSYGNEYREVYQYYSKQMFPTVERFGIKSVDRKIMLLNRKYNDFHMSNTYLKVPRVVTDRTTGDSIDMLTGKTINKIDYVRMKNKGDLSLSDFFGYQRVNLPGGDPLVTYDKDGNEIYVYKLINLLGDGYRAKEHYKDDRASVFQNGTVRINAPIEDAMIIEYYGGEIEKKDISSQPAQVRTTLPMSDDNVKKLETGEKTTTVRTQAEADKIDIPVGGVGRKLIGGKTYILRNRGFLNIQEAGGKTAMLKSEGVKDESELNQEHAKEFIRGERRLYVYDIKLLPETTPVQPSRLSALEEKMKSKGLSPAELKELNELKTAKPAEEARPIKEGAPEIIYKDKAKRVRLDYPAEIKVEATGDTFKTNKLLEIQEIFSGEDDGTISDQRKFDEEYQEWLGGYGMTDAEYQYALKNQEVLRDLLYIADRELTDNEGNELTFDTFGDVIDELLKRNERLVDTAQGRLFTGFDETAEFTEDQKNKILSNFGSKHEMNVEKAREYINQAMAEEPQKTIDKLKECYL